MDTNEVWARCGNCGKELKQGDKRCPKCGSTKRAYERKASLAIGVRIVEAGAKHRRTGHKRPIKEMLTRWKRSKDPQLQEGVNEERVIDREKDEYHQVVKDTRTGKVTHEEHQRLSEHNKQGRNRKDIFKKLGKWGIAKTIIIVVSVVGAIIGNLAWHNILPHLPSEQPIPPSVTSSPSPNPVVNTATTQSITITATPDFKPPYSRDIVETVHNPNSYKCYMVLEFKTSDGFGFLPISSKPENFRIEEGYEYEDVMRVYIKDFPPNFTYNLNLSVYTMNPDTFGGTEKISFEVLEVQKEQ